MTQRILIVDDDRLIHSALRSMLEVHGYQVSVATNGWSGLKAIEADKFDLMVVDIFMPGMDGIETIRAVRRSQPELPILVMSGLHHGHAFAFASGLMPDFLTMAMEFGAVQALHKPFTPEEFLHAVETCLTKSPSDAQARASAAVARVMRQANPR